MLRRSIPVLTLVALGLAAPAAHAAPSATFTGGVLTVSLPAAGDEAVIARSGTDIRLNGAAVAGGPDVVDTNQITFNAAGATRSVLDLRGGPFVDGVTEIPVDVNSTTGSAEFRILAGDGVDVITNTNQGIDLNDNAVKTDVQLNQVETIVIDGGGGNDRLTGYTDAEYLLGGAGDDRLVGGTDRDVLLGGEGADVLEGGLDADALDGGADDDEYHGGDGSDLLENSPGSDVIDGGPQITIGAGDRLSHLNMTAAGLITGTTSTDLARGSTLISGSPPDVIAGIEDFGGTPFTDIVSGTDANNRIDGLGGHDMIYGQGGQDRITGGDGGDFIIPGGNEDFVDSGPGPDIVNSADGGFDTVDCGADADEFTADAGDALSGCEISRNEPVTPPPPPPPPGPSGRTGPLRLAITAARSIKPRKGAVSFKVACPAVALGECRATASLRVKVKKRTRTLGARAFTLAAARQRTVKITLSRSARRLLNKEGKLKATIRITVRDDQGAGPVATRKVTLKRP